MNSLWAHLVNRIVTDNGQGHAELARRLDAGEVTEEESVFIKLKASAILLEQRISALVSNIETV